MTQQRLSYSAFKQYRTCPEQYRLDRVVGLDDRPGWYNAGGTAVHHMTEDNDWASLGAPVKEHEGWTYKDYLELAVVEEEKSSGFPRASFKTAGRKTKALPNGEDERWWLNEGPSMVRRWDVWRDKVPFDIWVTPDGEPAIEIQFSMEHGDDVLTPGTIDRVFQSRETGKLIVVDLKSGKPPKENVQLATYAEALTRRYSVECSIGGYWMARDGLLTGMHVLTQDMGAKLDYEFDTVAKAIRADIFPATPSGLCKNHCEMARFCYAGGQLSDPRHLPY
jgi:putative RecB family exonuclease